MMMTLKNGDNNDDDDNKNHDEQAVLLLAMSLKESAPQRCVSEAWCWNFERTSQGQPCMRRGICVFQCVVYIYMIID